MSETKKQYWCSNAIETYLNDIKEKQLKSKDYKLYSNHQQLCKAGGVTILVKRSLRTKIREDLFLNEPGLVESIFVELEIPGKCNTVLGSLHRIPNRLEKEFNWIYKKFINDWNINNELVIGIDQNPDLLKSDEHNQTQNFLETNLDHNLCPTITWPTRITKSTVTLIDNIDISNGLQNGFESCIMLSDISDHLQILTLVKKTNINIIKLWDSKHKT